MEAEQALVRVCGLTKRYSRRGARRGSPGVQALADIDLTIAPGATLALVGQSGSGKSTLARCLARLEEPTSGQIWFEGADLLALRGRRLRPFRERVQLILQDSASAAGSCWPWATWICARCGGPRSRSSSRSRPWP